MELRIAQEKDFALAMSMIDDAKRHLKAQGIDQWQQGYPDEACIRGDIAAQKGYFAIDEKQPLGYLCIDFDGEPAYDELNGSWISDGQYVVVHRLAFSDQSRGRGICGTVLRLVEEHALKKGVSAFRVDTDEDNQKMQHILKKNGFAYCGTIWFDNSEKIAFEKILRG